jgi:hypothetical protein
VSAAEAAYVRKALDSEWAEPARSRRRGQAAYQGEFPGQAATVLGRALAHGRQPDDTLWFGPGPLPGPAELATR